MEQENIQAIGKISRKGPDLVVNIPRQDRNKFRPGDHVVIVKIPSLEFMKASELVKV